jgi:hypothetical protein
MPGPRRNYKRDPITREEVENLIDAFDDTVPDFEISNEQDQQIITYDSVTKTWKNTTLGSVTITYGNLDGGAPDATYGGTVSISGGFYNSFP